MDWLFARADPTIDWNYAMITLVVRFIGVFVVMAVVQVAMQAASRAIQAVESRTALRAAAATAAASPSAAPAASPMPMMSLDVSAMADGDAVLDGRTVAAIGLALSLEAEQEAAAARRLSAAAQGLGGKASAWRLSGRLRGLR